MKMPCPKCQSTLYREEANQPLPDEGTFYLCAVCGTEGFVRKPGTPKGYVPLIHNRCLRTAYFMRLDVKKEDPLDPGNFLLLNGEALAPCGEFRCGSCGQKMDLKDFEDALFAGRTSRALTEGELFGVERFRKLVDEMKGKYQ